MGQHKLREQLPRFKQYYRFPLSIDEYCGNVIAQPDNSGYMRAFDWVGNEWISEFPIGGDLGEQLADQIVRYLNCKTEYRPDFIWSADPSGDPTIICMNGVPCIEIRGWSDLTSPACWGLDSKTAASVQDEFRDWIINKLNGNE